MQLSYTAYGTTGPAVVFLHGLMGRGRNFLSAAKALEDEYRCFLVDLPNHGSSPWTEDFDYEDMGQAVIEFIENVVLPETGEDSVVLLGHSMGAKTAMVAALRKPQLFTALIVEDMSPVSSKDSNFVPLLSALAGLDLDALESRSQADAELEEAGVSDPTVRGFLLQNLRRSDSGFEFQANVAMLNSAVGDINAFPEFETTYDGPVLWMGGAKSNYINDEHDELMRALFPRAHKVMVKDAGHWVHSEKPEEFLAVLRGFLKQTADK